VPNKAFITEQFINWSLSDSVTRVVLTVPAPADANSEEVTQILYTAAERCTFVIDNPAPEVFLVISSKGFSCLNCVSTPPRWGTVCRCATRSTS
jgi:potassium efflux system protein